MSRETDLAWLAGFFDGEGCVRGRSYWRKIGEKRCHKMEISLVITQREQAILERCQVILGKGVLRHRTNPADHYVLLIAGHQQVAQAIELLLPYSVVKREQLLVAKELTERCNFRYGRGYVLPSEELEARISLLEKLRDLKHHWQLSFHRLAEKEKHDTASQLFPL